VTRNSLHGVLAQITALSALAAGRASAADAASTHYALDPAHSTLAFQFVQADARNDGKFTKFPVSLDLAADNPGTGKLDVTVELNSVDTGDKERDDTLRGPDLFDVARFPQAHFISTQITRTASGYDAVGKLTLRGVTRDVHVPFTFRTAEEQGKSVGYLTGKTLIRRLDFGVGQGDWKSTEWVGAEVSVSYSLRLFASGH